MRLLHLVSCLITSLSACSLAAATCSLCRDGGSTTVPDKIVFLPGDYPDLDCASLETVVPAIFKSDEECEFVHQFSSICGCSRPADSCNLCPDGSPTSKPHATAPGAFDELFGTPLSCEIVEAYLHSVSGASDVCAYAHRNVASTCGCKVDASLKPLNEASPDVLGKDSTPAKVDSSIVVARFYGAESVEDRKTQQRIYQSSAILSLLAAFVVIVDNLRSRERCKKLYNQTILMMAVYDFIFAASAACGQLALPVDATFDPTGARGTMATCQAQGFFFLLGLMTSLCFNASLSTYFMLVIVYGYRERRMNQMKKWLLGIPIFSGMVFACASIPFTVPGFGGCSISLPISLVSDTILESWGFSSDWGPYLGLFLVPGFVVLAYSSVCLLRVYLRVRSARTTNRRFDFVRRASLSSLNRRGRTLQRSISILHQEVAWQSALYLGALYLSWFVYLVITANIDKFLHGYYNLWCFMSFVVPFQPFSNCIVYFRPRLARLGQRLNETLRRKIRGWRLWSSSADIPTSDGRSIPSDKSVHNCRWSISVKASEPAADIMEEPGSGKRMQIEGVEGVYNSEQELQAAKGKESCQRDVNRQVSWIMTEIPDDDKSQNTSTLGSLSQHRLPEADDDCAGACLETDSSP